MEQCKLAKFESDELYRPKPPPPPASIKKEVKYEWDESKQPKLAQPAAAIKNEVKYEWDESKPPKLAQLQLPPTAPQTDWQKLKNDLYQIRPDHNTAQGLQTFHQQRSLTVERLYQMHKSSQSLPAQDAAAVIPTAIRVELMKHQRYALTWMQWREDERPRGGILADDMGLGKTLSIITLVLAHMQHIKALPNCSDADDRKNNDDEDEPHFYKSLHKGGTLIVCPASLINQWDKEVERRLQRHSMSVCVFHGPKRERDAEKLSSFDMVVTTYAIMSVEHRANGPLFRVKWTRIVLDEAHIIRNRNTAQAKACFDLRGDRRWVLTGTPIQNKELDMFALLCFLRCSPFDDYPVYRKWLCKSGGAIDRLRTVITPMLLRRTKVALIEAGEMKNMPSKTIESVSIVLERDEMNVYQKILAQSQKLFAQFLHQRAERNCDFRGMRDSYARTHNRMKKFYGGRGGNEAFEEIQPHMILTHILRLRQICCHPGLIDKVCLFIFYCY